MRLPLYLHRIVRRGATDSSGHRSSGPNTLTATACTASNACAAANTPIVFDMAPYYNRFVNVTSPNCVDIGRDVGMSKPSEISTPRSAAIWYNIRPIANHFQIERQLV